MMDPETGEPYGTAYWTGPGEEVSDDLEGDDSALIMDRALGFIEESADEGRPFFAVVWFHAPHKPVVAGPEHLARHPDRKGSAQHYRGCLSAMDDQVGRLRAALRAQGVADETMLWFTSDNGPEGNNDTLGTTRGLRGRKRSLFEGGVRVPGILEWPARVRAGTETATPAVTSDYLPTVLSLLGLELCDERPMDGVDLSPLLNGEAASRNQAIGFHSGGRQAWIDGAYKLVKNGKDKPFGLYDLNNDPAESADLAAEHPRRAERMRDALDVWRSSCAVSAAGEDYR
jgi:arylsulfatase A-like enzyme